VSENSLDARGEINELRNRLTTDGSLNGCGCATRQCAGVRPCDAPLRQSYAAASGRRAKAVAGEEISNAKT